MSEKPDLIPIQTYAKQYASAVCEQFFQDFDVITGQQIVSLAKVHQVNLMVVKNIFQAWQQETRKLESPLFDYQAAEVREALNQFMNVLSRNISIEREHFQKLFAKSTEETLLLLFYPGYYFKIFFKEFDKKIHIANELLPALKYIRIHTPFVEQIKQHLAKEGETIKRKDAIELVATLAAQQDDALETPHAILEQFDEEMPIGLFELAPSWEAVPDAEEEPIGFDDDVLPISHMEEFPFDEAEEDKMLEQEISEEFEKPFFEETPSAEADEDEDDEEEDEDEIYIADHLKSDLDPVNDNVFISNQEDILNAAIIDDFDFEDKPTDTSVENEAEALMPNMFAADNPFAKVTNDLSDLASLAGDDDLPLHFEDDDDPMYSVEETESPTENNVENEVSEDDLEVAEPSSPKQTEIPKVSASVQEPTTKEPTFDTPPHGDTKKDLDEEDESFNAFLAKRMNKEEKEQPTVLDKLKAGSIKKLQGNIPLHLKFKFQNDLFGGDPEEFNHALELIDQAPDYHEALALIKSRYVLKYDWDFSDESTLEFIGLVEDKYD